MNICLPASPRQKLGAVLIGATLIWAAVTAATLWTDRPAFRENVAEFLLVLVALLVLGVAVRMGIGAALLLTAALFLAMGQTYLVPLRQVLSSGRWLPLAALAAIPIAEAIIRRRSPRPLYFFDGLVGTWLSFAFFSGWYSIDPSLTFQRAASLLLLFLAVFWGVWRVADSHPEREIVDLLLMAALVVYGLSWALLSFLRVLGSPTARFQGILENPNSIGLLTALLLPMAL